MAWTRRPLASTTARGYGTAHQRLRRQLQRHIDNGRGTCWRCGGPIPPGTAWHLGHDDQDRNITRGTEHVQCNLTAAARKANATRRSSRLRW